MAQRQATKNGDPQRAAHLGTFAKAHNQRHRAEHAGEVCHQNRSQAQQRGAVNALLRIEPFAALQLQREVDHHDGVLHHDTDQQEQPQHGDQTQTLAAELERQQRTQPGRRQGRENGQRMQRTLVEHTEHQIHRQQHGNKDPRLNRSAKIVGRRRCLMHIARQHHLVENLRDGLLGLRFGDARRQRIPHAHRGKLPFVAHAVFSHAVTPGSEAGEWHPLPLRAHNLELGQHFRTLGVARVQLHHHPILVQLVVQGGNLTLREGVVQGRGDSLHIDAETPRGFAVDIEHHLTSLVAVHRIHIHQQRALRHRLGNLARPHLELRQRVRAQQYLVFTAPIRRAELQILIDHQHHHYTRHRRCVGAQAIDHRLGGDLAFGQRFEPNGQLGVGQTAAAAAGAGQVGDRRIGQNVLPVGLDLRLHDLERHAVIAAQEAANLPRILLRQRFFRQGCRQPDTAADRRQQHQQCDRFMVERPMQRAVVATAQSGKQGVPIILLVPGRRGFQPQRAQAGRQRQRYQQRDQHGRHQGDGKLLEQLTDQAAQQQDRGKHHRQCQRHGNQGKAQLPGTARCGVQRRQAVAHVPLDVFQHHNGVIHHQAGTDDQRHQRQVVEREAEEIHDHKAADQRDRNRR